MNTHIINIGDELLIGQVINTNASWMALQLNLSGVNVSKTIVIADSEKEIENSILSSLKEADCILITGGLGPTKDDITKTTLAKLFSSPLIENKEVLENIKNIFSLRGFPLTSTNRKQALVPKDCKVINNPYGTAPGMCFEKDNKLIISMPGVPFEMQNMMTNYVIPLILSHYKPIAIIHKTLLTCGLGESFLSDLIEPFELSLPKYIKLAYLPSANFLRLRLSAKGENRDSIEKELNNQVNKLLPLIKDYFIGFDFDDPSLVLAEELKKRKQTISTAESCTGGNIAHRITINPGASQYYKGSVVSYSNQTKIQVLGVEKEFIETFGAVSREVAEKMAKNVREKLNTTYSIATTGIAGPSGGSEEKPVGDIWIAIACENGDVISKKFNFYSSRENFISRATNQALFMIINLLSTTEI
ncbi:MAG: competence/damage-inducible protein A [Bacteroidales bacterium]|jgi:nicotinamide-nucleotide amidase|nr:competence/damage-inducible protein A [Bacteroidales bacterium]